MIKEKQYTKIFDSVIKQNNPEYNYTKLVEELNELGTICLQIVNKGKTEERVKNLVEELGDVLLRISILQVAEKLETAVEIRIREKLIKYENYLKNNKYKGKI